MRVRLLTMAACVAAGLAALSGCARVEAPTPPASTPFAAPAPSLKPSRIAAIEDAVAAGFRLTRDPAAGAVGAPYVILGHGYTPKADPDYDVRGVASWYGGDLDGALTANGERFDAGAMTGAHKTLPLGSLVRVTNLGNGKVVILRINDRGPFAPGRVMEVSYAGAQALGFVDEGLANVRVEFLGYFAGPAAPVLRP